MSNIRKIIIGLLAIISINVYSQKLSWNNEISNYLKDNSWQFLKSHFESDAAYNQLINQISYKPTHPKAIYLKKNGFNKQVALIRPFKVVPIEKYQYRLSALDTTLTYLMKFEVDTLKHKIISYSISKQ